MLQIYRGHNSDFADLSYMVMMILFLGLVSCSAVITRIRVVFTHHFHRYHIGKGNEEYWSSLLKLQFSPLQLVL